MEGSPQAATAAPPRKAGGNKQVCMQFETNIPHLYRWDRKAIELGQSGQELLTRPLHAPTVQCRTTVQVQALTHHHRAGMLVQQAVNLF